MKNLFLIIVCTLVFCCSVVFSADTVLVEDGFEHESFSRWQVTRSDKININRPGYSGNGALSLKLAKGKKATLQRNLKIPAVHNMRLLKVSFTVKSSGDPKGLVTVSILKKNAEGKAEWFNRRNFKSPSIFGTAPRDAQWQVFNASGFFGPEVASLKLYINAESFESDFEVWIDDIKVELLDRGIMFGGRTGNNIFPGEKIVLPCTVSSPARIVGGEVRLRDETGKTLQVLPIKKNAAIFDVELSSPGYYAISSEAFYDDGTRFGDSFSAAVMGKEVDSALRKSSPFGVNYGPADQLEMVGAGWSRNWFDLASGRLREFADSGYHHNTNRVQKSWRESPVEIVRCFNGQPEWLQIRPAEKSYHHHHLYPISDKKKFAELVKYLMQSPEYQPRYVELANEPGVSWKGGSVEKLYEYLRLVAESVKAVYPDTVIIGPSLCNIGSYRMQTLEKLVRLGMFKFVDELAIHPYVMATPPEAEFIQRVRELKQKLAEWGYPDMPIHVTEYGWTNPPGDWQASVDLLTQARYCSRSLILLAAEHIKSINYFRYGGVNPKRGSAGYYMHNWWDGSPKPVWAAFAGTSRALMGLDGPGKVFNLSPTTYLAVFRRGEKSVIALWDTDADKTETLPLNCSNLRDMTGRPVHKNGDGTVNISPSPIFAVVDEPEFYNISVSAELVLLKGQTVPVNGNPKWIPSPLLMREGNLRIPRETPGGDYLLIGKSGNNWKALRAKVYQAADIARAPWIDWPENSKVPLLNVEVFSHLDNPASAKADLLLAGVNRQLSVSSKVASHKTALLRLPLHVVEPGQRYSGEIKIRLTDKTGSHDLSRQLDFTVLECPKGRIARYGDISSWGPFSAKGGGPVVIDPEDCQVSLGTFYDDSGLRLLLEVRDDIHNQNNQPGDMWRGDSVQIAFDADSNLPWQGNVGGWNGHRRIYEYGVALGTSGEMNWRWMSYDGNLSPENHEPLVQSQIIRKGKSTLYKITFPWKTIGMEKMPSAGDEMGFSLLVNDVDNATSPRKCIALFGGIADQKNPKEYGKLFFRK